MLSTHPSALYKRLLMLGLLCACLGVFGSDVFTEHAYARICIEACYDRQRSCYDACTDTCGTTDPNCNGCITTCDSLFYTCVSGSQTCNIGYAYTPSCQVYYGGHCLPGPYPNAPPNCTDPSVHNGYYEVCNYGPGGSQCVSCPDGEICTGSGDVPPCL
jgi:hypothetical protein